MASIHWQSPIGPLALVEDGQALTQLRFGEDTLHDEEETPLLREAIRQLQAYFSGSLQAFDLPLAPAGTAFQRQVWDALLTIPYGQTDHYQAIAQRIGNPKAMRAVGMANNRNPLPIFIPCHRVIGKNGGLVGYGGGLPAKEYLLALEKRRDWEEVS